MQRFQLSHGNYNCARVSLLLLISMLETAHLKFLFNARHVACCVLNNPSQILMYNYFVIILKGKLLVFSYYSCVQAFSYSKAGFLKSESICNDL